MLLHSEKNGVTICVLVVALASFVTDTPKICSTPAHKEDSVCACMLVSAVTSTYS